MAAGRRTQNVNWRLQVRKRITGFALALALVVGGVVLGSGTAQAAGGGCSKGTTDSLWYPVDAHVRLEIEISGRYICVTTVHTAAYFGNTFGTGVRMTQVSSGDTKVDYGQYAYYAGPVAFTGGGCYRIISSDYHVELPQLSCL